MLYGDENIKLKQVAFLLVGSRFKRCAVWNEEEYLATHRNKEFLKHAIASKKVELLQKDGLSYGVALKKIFLEGEQKVNRKNLSLLGKPIWDGAIDELSNQLYLYDKNVCNIHITGRFCKRIDIVLKDDMGKERLTVDSISFKTGDSVFWLDSDGDIIEHTYIGNIGDIAILSGEMTERSINGSGFPIGGFPLINRYIQNKIIDIAKQNRTYTTYPVCFADVKNLYASKHKAESALEAILTENTPDEINKEKNAEEMIEYSYRKENGEYIDWLENMLTMLSKNYLDLVHVSSEKNLKEVPLPASNATRKAIRLISQNARPAGKELEDNCIEQFTQNLIEKQHLK